MSATRASSTCRQPDGPAVFVSPGSDLDGAGPLAVGFGGVGNDVRNRRDNLRRVHENILDVVGDFNPDVQVFAACLSAGKLRGFVEHLPHISRSDPGLGRLGETHQIFDYPRCLAGILPDLLEYFSLFDVALGLGEQLRPA